MPYDPPGCLTNRPPSPTPSTPPRRPRRKRRSAVAATPHIRAQAPLGDTIHVANKRAKIDFDDSDYGSTPPRSSSTEYNRKVPAYELAALQPPASAQSTQPSSLYPSSVTIPDSQEEQQSVLHLNVAALESQNFFSQRHPGMSNEYVPDLTLSYLGTYVRLFDSMTFMVVGRKVPMMSQSEKRAVSLSKCDIWYTL